MKILGYALLLGLSLLLLNFALTALERKRGPGAATAIFLVGCPLAILLAALPVGLTNAPDWSFGVAVGLTLGLVLARTLRAGLRGGRPPGQEVPEDGREAKIPRWLVTASIGIAFGILLIVGGMIQAFSESSESGTTDLVLGVCVIAAAGLAAFLLRRIDSERQ